MACHTPPLIKVKKQGEMPLPSLMGSKICGGDDGSGPEPNPLNSKLWYFFPFPLTIFIMSFNIDVGVAINDYHRHLRGEGGRVFMTVM